MERMREVKFRGMPIEDYGDTKWFQGNAIINYEDKLAYIEASGQGFVPVKWGTVSQYTGLKDKNDKEIYEGDIIFHKKFGEYSEITYFERGMCFIGLPVEKEVREDYLKGNVHYLDLTCENLQISKCRVIGNIYENPELLKGANENE
jgi:uncharacterized phage protein (TIGR01671 family)